MRKKRKQSRTYCVWCQGLCESPMRCEHRAAARVRVFERDHGICAECGANAIQQKLGWYIQLTKVEIGCIDLNNLRTLCRSCFWIYKSACRSGPKLICPLCQILRRRVTMHRDHDHITGKFRGLICRRCNLGIGWIENALHANDVDKAFRALKKWFRKSNRERVLTYLSNVGLLAVTTGT